jgi:hypothetical protein
MKDIVLHCKTAQKCLEKSHSFYGHGREAHIEVAWQSSQPVQTRVLSLKSVTLYPILWSHQLATVDFLVCFISCLVGYKKTQ